MASPLSTLNVAGFGMTTFDSTAQPVGSSLVLVALLQLGGSRAFACVDIVNGAAALTHLTLSRCGVAGGHAANQQVNFAVDAAINTASNDVPSAFPAGLSTLAASGVGSIRLAGLQGVQEIGVWAQCATSTTLQVHGSVMDNST